MEPIFKYIQIESVIKDNPEEYYKAIAKSTNEGKIKYIYFLYVGCNKQSDKGYSQWFERILQSYKYSNQQTYASYGNISLIIKNDNG